MEDDLNFKVNGRQAQFTSPASPELGTAQPQLVLFFFFYSFNPNCSHFFKLFIDCKVWLVFLKMNSVYFYELGQTMALWQNWPLEGFPEQKCLEIFIFVCF
jgi:hypothetical protein